jgi:hypothetical protein
LKVGDLISPYLAEPDPFCYLSRISAPNWFLLPLMLSRSESMVIYSLSGSV